MSFIDFMASGMGRVARVVLGLVLIVLGWFVVGGAAGIIIAIVGIIPLVAGLADFCVFAPLFGLPLAGAAIRGRKH